MKKILDKCDGFQWDEGNSEKNWFTHRVSKKECEQAFFNLPVTVFDDTRHSNDEKRWYLLGKTDLNRHLFVVFTMRKNFIRIISARNISKKERKIYYEEVKRHTEI